MHWAQRCRCCSHKLSLPHTPRRSWEDILLLVRKLFFIEFRLRRKSIYFELSCITQSRSFHFTLTLIDYYIQLLHQFSHLSTAGGNALYLAQPSVLYPFVPAREIFRFGSHKLTLISFHPSLGLYKFQSSQNSPISILSLQTNDSMTNVEGSQI